MLATPYEVQNEGCELLSGAIRNFNQLLFPNERRRRRRRSLIRRNLFVLLKRRVSFQNDFQRRRRRLSVSTLLARDADGISSLN